MDRIALDLHEIVTGEWRYEESDDICWYVQKTLWAELEEKGIPDYLKLPEKEILLLK